MNRSKATRFLAMLLTVVMVIGLVPMSVFAEEVGAEDTLTATVSFDVNGGSGEFTPQTVVVGEKAQKPETDPTHYLYEFAYWTANLKENVEWDFETPITEDVTLYAVWGTPKELPLYNPAVSGDYFQIISSNTYDLAPGAQEHELILNNAEGSDRKIVHVFEVDTKNEDLEVMPGYYGIDKLDPENLPLDGVADKKQFWKAEQLTKTFKYYEGMGYNVVGAMNTALAYDSDAPYGYMVWNGVVLGTPEVHKGAQTYLAIDWDGNCELRSMSTPLTGNEKTAIPANFNWIVKDGELVSKTVERAENASRSMIGIKADGTLVFCLVDGRNEPTSSGLSNYELGEMMLALGCANAVNCDGGGSSTFVSKRVGESTGTMRSIPSDGSERATINSVILVSTAGASGELDKVLFGTKYDYVAPGASMAFSVTGQDTKAYPMDIPAEVIYQVAEEGMGTIANGVFTAGSTTGTATIQAVYNGEVVGEKKLTVVHPKTFGFTAAETVLPYGKSMKLEVVANYGVDNWAVCIDGAYSLALSDENAATLEGITLIGTTDESIKDVTVTATYLPDPARISEQLVVFGKGSEIIYDFEDGNISSFLGVDEMYDWAEETGAPAPIQSNGNYSEDADSETFLATRENGGQVRNGDHALGVTLDYTDAQFASWSYNMFFHTGEAVVLRDVANGKAATTFGMWVYIPEGAAGLAMQLTAYVGKTSEAVSGTQIHFYFTTVSGAVKNLNSCTEADIPESRWVYATCDLTANDYVSLVDPMSKAYGREPCFIRFYVKPTTAAMLNFYFDDFALDYSSAVDDRVLPTITGVSYATQDTAVELNNGATVNGNAITFTANVADNQALAIETGKILVDGIALNTTVSGKVMSSAEAILTSGDHTVTFEIKDRLGNPAKVTRTFTVAGEAPITLGGHNDGGFKPGDDANKEGAPAPEYDSVYYVDLKAADIANLSSITATLLLQSANTWEPAGMVVAPGFEVTSWSVNQYSNELTITVNRTSFEKEDADAAVVSIPVRLWSWNGVNHVTDVAVDRETQYKTGNNPVINVECKVVYGKAEYVSGEFGAFGGSISVNTKINDVVYPWHYHDAELTVLNQDATCTEDGYTGRTYCETCKSVIDWGTKVSATGHTYVLTDEVLSCHCGALFTGIWEEDGKTYVDGVALADGWFQNSYYRDGVMLTGVQKVPAPDASGEFYYDFGEDGVCKGGAKYTGVFLDTEANVYRYAQVGVIATGWQLIGVDWYYFDPATQAAATGDQKMGVVTYTFEETGRLTSGVWAKTLYGTKYYYGPGAHQRGWKTIDGKDYFFENFYRVEGGIQCVFENNINPKWYKFGEDGACDRSEIVPDGFYTDRNGFGYSKNGEGLTDLQLIDGTYYFFNRLGYAITGEYIGYYFGEDYKAYTGLREKNGTMRYYRNGKPNMAGLIEIDGAYYFAAGDGVLITNQTYYVWQGNGIIPESTREFGSDGKMLDGIVERNGNYYYYDMGQPKMAGLVEVDGAYYFAKNADGLLATGEYYVWQGNGILPESTREFGSDGKMLDGIVEKDGNYYYYDMGQPKMAGLVEVGGYYYFARDAKGSVITNQFYYVWKSNGLMPEGNYQFDEHGRMCDGIVEMNGGYYYYESGKAKMAGLVEVNGYYYFATGEGKIITNQAYYVWQGNGILPEGTYEFDAEGKMIDGIIERDGKYYYYNMGRPQMAGLIEVDGAYYFAKDAKGTLITNQAYYVWMPNDIIPESTREFGSDGKMLDGIVEKNGNYYYYNMGRPEMAGLVEVDGYYYFAKDANGLLITNQTYYVWKGNGILPEGSYEFGADGKILDGFVEKADGLYYYENGKPGEMGLTYVDGYYYFVSTNGKLITNQTYYVWKTNGYCIEGNYTFDKQGRIVL